MTRLGPRTALADIALVVSLPLVWGLNYVVIKGALPAFSSPQCFNALRWVLGSLILIVLALARRERLWIDRDDWGRVAVVVALGLVVQQVTFINGLADTTAGHSALILGLSPAAVGTAGALLGLEHISGRMWGGIALSVLGLALVNRPGSGTLPSTATLGDALTFCSMLSWVLYTYASRPLAMRYPATALSAVNLSLATMVLVLLAVPDLRAQSWTAISLGDWLAVVYAGALTIAFGYIAWTLAVRRLGAARSSVITNVNPVVALVSAWAFLGERLTVVQACGAACVVAGVALTRLDRARRPADQRP